MNKEYVLGWKEAPERISINFVKELNKEYVLGLKEAPERIFINFEILILGMCTGGGGRRQRGFSSILNKN